MLRQMKANHLATPNDDLLTREELAARLKVTSRTVFRLQSDGVVPFILLGKSVRFYWPAVVSHLNANSTVTKRTLTGNLPVGAKKC
jgi:excisionase family DNA binding protein